MQASAMVATSAALLTSTRCAVAVPPSAVMRPTVSSAAALLMSAQNTRAPSRANATAVALPLPQPGPIDPAPTTSATLPLSRSAMSVLLLRRVKPEQQHHTAPTRMGLSCTRTAKLAGLLDLVPDAGSVPCLDQPPDHGLDCRHMLTQPRRRLQ